MPLPPHRLSISVILFTDIYVKTWYFDVTLHYSTTSIQIVIVIIVIIIEKAVKVTALNI